MIEYQLGDYPHASCMSGAKQVPELAQGVVDGIDTRIIGNIITVIPLRRRIKGEQPECSYSQLLQVIQLANQALEIADAVSIGVGERLEVYLVNDGIPVPEGIVLKNAIIMTHFFLPVGPETTFA
jgi:hypothetical protein